MELEQLKAAADLRRKALKSAKLASWLTRIFRIDRPHVLREMSLLYSGMKKPRKALRYAEKSCLVAKAQDAHYELLQSTFVKAKLECSLQESPRARDEYERAARDLSLFEAEALASGQALAEAVLTKDGALQLSAQATDDGKCV